MRTLFMLLIAICLITATSAAVAHQCACKSGSQSECHKQMAKQEKKQCCCDKAMGCKLSFNAIAPNTAHTIAFVSASYSFVNEYTNSFISAPVFQPPQG